MKRIAILLVVALAFSVQAFSDEAVLIDFAQLAADYTVGDGDTPNENQATITDFSVAAGSSFTADEKALMKTSLSIENWEVILNSSANSVDNARYSYTKEATVSATASKTEYQGATILGVRVMFPTGPFNSVATLRPPFAIPAYADKETIADDGTLSVPQEEVGRGQKFDGIGVVKNVGVLKSVSVNVYGINFPHGFSIVLRDNNNTEHEYFMGYLNFDGWRTLTWENPNYVQDVRDRELNTFPLYPESAPLLKLDSFKIYKDAAMTGGDFVGYIKDVSLVYDKAVLSLERDIDDELTWGILQDRESSRRNAELQRLGELQVQRFLERKKMDDPAAREEANAAANANP